MLIGEAVRIALDQDKCITRNSFGWGHAKIKPTTNENDCLFLVLTHHENKRIPRWNPTANDLMSDNWAVVE